MRVLHALRSHPLLVLAAVLGLAYLLFGDRLPEVDVEKALEDLAERLGKLTYLFVGALAFLETGAFVGLVFPGETAVIIGGAIAGQGETSIVLTIAIVWFCAWAGDTVSFFIGRRLGRDFILRHGSRVRITPERFGQVETYMERHGGKTILIGRFLGLVRALAPFIAGSSGMRYHAFVPYSVLGTGLWTVAFSLLGYFLAESLGRAGEIAGRGTLVFGTFVTVIVVTVVAVRFMRDPQKRAGLARRMERNRALRPALALGRRLEPQARFLWQRLTPGNLGLEFTTLIAALAVAAFVLAGYAVIVSGDPGPTPGDATAMDLARDLRAGWFTDLNRVMSALGSSVVTIPIAAIAAIALWLSGRREEALALVAAVALTHAGVITLKELIERPRPEGALVGSRGFAFPSGHAAYAVLYPWLAITAAVRLRPGMAGASALVVAGIALAAAVGLSRVYLGVHFLSDANAGAALGVAAFAICASVALVVTHVRHNLRRA